MIEPNEIRIGNLLLWDRSKQGLPDEIVTVYNITRTYIRAYTEIDELDEVLIHYEDLKPMPTTKELLVDFGFTHACKYPDGKEGVEIKNKKPSKHIYVRIGYNESFFTLFNHSECDANEKQYINEVKYAHKLQNLYFGLTEMELEKE